VSSGGQFVFGSAGTRVQRGSKMHDEPTEGQVDLSLRLQWVIGVPANELFALANGEQFVSGDLIAILDPYELVSLDQQISDLQFAILSSQFGTDFMAALDRVRGGSDVSEVIDPTNDPFGTSASIFESSSTDFDPFATSFNSGEVVEEQSLKKEKRRRKKDDSSDGGSSPKFGDFTADPFSDPFKDPFA
jgi:hypothetical protein